MFPTIRPIRTPEEREALAKAAEADGHITLWPTHLLEKGTEIIGYVGINSMPTVNVWTKTGSVTARESMTMLWGIETMMRDRNMAGYVMPCADNSPYFPFMERLGYTEIGTTTLHAVKL